MVSNNKSYRVQYEDKIANDEEQIEVRSFNLPLHLVPVLRSLIILMGLWLCPAPNKQADDSA